VKKIWTIKLVEVKFSKYKVSISYKGGKEVKGNGPTPQMAYNDATNKLVIKPWLVNAGGV